MKRLSLQSTCPVPACSWGEELVREWGGRAGEDGSWKHTPLPVPCPPLHTHPHVQHAHFSVQTHFPSLSFSLPFLPVLFFTLMRICLGVFQSPLSISLPFVSLSPSLSSSSWAALPLQPSSYSLNAHTLSFIPYFHCTFSMFSYV